MSTGYTASETLTPFSEIVANVQNGRPEGLDQLYRLFRMLTGSLRRYLGFKDFDDRLHDVYLVVVDNIRQGELREAYALPSYINGVARLWLCSTIRARARQQRLAGSLQYWVSLHKGKTTSEDLLAERERAAAMRELLGRLPPKECEILTRFYLDEQPKEQICGEMQLTGTQFRLAKSRGKQRLTGLIFERLHPGREVGNQSV